MTAKKTPAKKAPAKRAPAKKRPAPRKAPVPAAEGSLPSAPPPVPGSGERNLRSRIVDWFRRALYS